MVTNNLKTANAEKEGEFAGDITNAAWVQIPSPALKFQNLIPKSLNIHYVFRKHFCLNRD